MKHLTVEQCNNHIQAWIKTHKAYYSHLSTQASRESTLEKAYRAFVEKDWEFFDFLLNETARMQRKVNDACISISREISKLYDEHKDHLNACTRMDLLCLAGEALSASSIAAVYSAHEKASEIIKSDFSNSIAKLVLRRHRLKEKV